MYVYIYIYIYTYIYIYIYIYRHIHIHIHICIYACVCVYMYMGCIKDDLLPLPRSLYFSFLFDRTVCELLSFRIKEKGILVNSIYIYTHAQIYT